jgi:hypothetical protein
MRQRKTALQSARTMSGERTSAQRRRARAARTSPIGRSDEPALAHDRSRRCHRTGMLGMAALRQIA